jgi:hypothetical protein
MMGGTVFLVFSAIGLGTATIVGVQLLLGWLYDWSTDRVALSEIYDDLVAARAVLRIRRSANQALEGLIAEARHDLGVRS